jgi:transcription antitermination factor NusG
MAVSNVQPIGFYLTTHLSTPTPGDKRILDTQIVVQEGDKIRFLNGPFAGCDGDFTVKHVNRHKREVEVEFTLMGATQRTKVTVEFVDRVA